ncbi:hypothetical protein MHPYR_470047 [uncultured Mycobacterium sp.]|uniref:Uncharacterized protein n=1 Tax=uncultured Mycobacterium sp. TaxID=171292 RepID=A0A1Y5PGE4_9MYCO|nr:hypothetical protein MHPYR_470047 [uncultured Mycobacterium sp.]
MRAAAGRPARGDRPNSLQRQRHGAPKDAVAKVNCDLNADTEGSASATYTLVADNAALDKALSDTIAGPAPKRVNAARGCCGVHGIWFSREPARLWLRRSLTVRGGRS